MWSDARARAGCEPAQGRRRARGGALALLALLAAVGPARAMDEEGCLNCHGLEGFAARRGGEAVPLAVSAEEFDAGAHGALECRECHADIASIPHPEARRDTNCGLVCHAHGGGSTSHEKLYWDYAASVHGSARERRITCLVCHPASAAAAQGRDKMREVRLCAACHRGKAAVRAYFSDAHFLALAGGAGHAPACPDCHTAHRVRRPGAEESSVSAKNLAATCGSGALAEARSGACHGTLAAAAVSGASMVTLPRGGRGGALAWLLRLLAAAMLLGLLARAGVGLVRER